MWHKYIYVENTSGYRHTIIGPTKRFSTYGGNPPDNAVPSTYDSRSAVNNSNNRLNPNPHRSYCHSAGNLARAGHLFRVGKFFRALKLSALAGLSAQTELSALRPPSLRESPDPSSRTLGPTQHVSHGFPWLHPNARTHVYPERAGIPSLKGRCHSSLGSSGDISIFHSGVSRGHRNVP